LPLVEGITGKVENMAYDKGAAKNVKGKIEPLPQLRPINGTDTPEIARI
jgi:hypothetical protein